MNLSKTIVAARVINDMKDIFHDYSLKTSSTEMMGISDHGFLHNSMQMPYKNALHAYRDLKEFASFKFNGSSRSRTITPFEFVQGITTISRPKRHVYIFTYCYDLYNSDIYMYEKETGVALVVNPEQAEPALRHLLFSVSTREAQYEFSQ